MDINELTIGQAKELTDMFSNKSSESTGLNCMIGNKSSESTGLNCMIGKKVIVRTYSAGVWFGELEQKDKNEVILVNARRMWQWWAKEGISLSAVAVHGIKKDKSKIAEAVDSVWLEAIEIIPCTDAAINLIESAQNAKAE